MWERLSNVSASCWNALRDRLLYLKVGSLVPEPRERALRIEIAIFQPELGNTLRVLLFSNVTIL